MQVHGIWRSGVTLGHCGLFVLEIGSLSGLGLD